MTKFSFQNELFYWFQSHWLGFRATSTDAIFSTKHYWIGKRNKSWTKNKTLNPKIIALYFLAIFLDLSENFFPYSFIVRPSPINNCSPSTLPVPNTTGSSHPLCSFCYFLTLLFFQFNPQNGIDFPSHFRLFPNLSFAFPRPFRFPGLFLCFFKDIFQFDFLEFLDLLFDWQENGAPNGDNKWMTFVLVSTTAFLRRFFHKIKEKWRKAQKITHFLVNYRI